VSHVAELVAVGTEILLGNIANTDAQMISRGLSELGINVFHHTVVGDNPERLGKTIALAASRADIIITTGGLGPTADDLTKETVAGAFGKKLNLHQPTVKRIDSYFARTGRKPTENNYKQAMLPEGCHILENDWGTAPGCAFESDGVTVIMLPGPPRECTAMFHNCALPYLRSRFVDGVLVSRNLHVFGMGESAVEAKLFKMISEMKNPTVAPYAKEGEMFLRVTAKAESEQEAQAMIEPVAAEIYSVLGDLIYTDKYESLEDTVVSGLKQTGITLSVAESCTGGSIAKRITDIPGSSAVFMGGVCTYSTASKTALLGIPEQLIAEKGAVSCEVAEQMAVNVRKKFSSDLAVSVTGLAGPDGDGSGLPVGRVYVALACADGVWCRPLDLGSGRERIRVSAANHGLDMVRRYISGLPVVQE